jgi:uncharacterized membrane protein YfcA
MLKLIALCFLLCFVGIAAFGQVPNNTLFAVVFFVLLFGTTMWFVRPKKRKR